jgi:hypothetical protein
MCITVSAGFRFLASAVAPARRRCGGDPVTSGERKVEQGFPLREGIFLNDQDAVERLGMVGSGQSMTRLLRCTVYTRKSSAWSPRSERRHGASQN